jgi:elongation factor G
MIRERLGANPLIMALPIGAEKDFKGIILLLEKKALIWEGDQTGAKFHEAPIPQDMVSEVEKYRNELIEKVCETDDVLLEQYLNGKIPTDEELKKALRKATITYKLVPIFVGSSLRHKGVQPLLDAVIDYLPSPVDILPVEGYNPVSQKTETRATDINGALSGLAFKIQTDPHVGRLTYVRIYSGTLKSGSYIYNATKDKQERVGRLLLMHANKREEVDQAFAGEIVAIVGFKETITGDTLCTKENPIILESISFPEPVISLAIEPKTRSDQEKLGYALRKLAEEDPTFKIKTNFETGQTIISGMGELHLEIIADRLKREFKVDANTGSPMVAYKETIKKLAAGEGKYVHQSGGRGQYGHCVIRVEPKTKGEGYEFENAVKGGAIPREFIAPAEKGIKEALENGVLAGYPITDIKVTLYDGSFHEVDSSEIAFKIAGSDALKNAVKNAQLVLLEPIMKLEVNVPDEYMGDVIGDLSARRAQILGTESRSNLKIIKAHVPLAEMSQYATGLRSKTAGRGTFYMEPSHYEEVPKNITEQIVTKKVSQVQKVKN